MPELAVIGATHRTSPYELRDRVTPGETEIGLLTERLGADSRLGEVVLLATCDRVEAVTMTDAPLAARAALAQLLAERAGLPVALVGDLLETRTGAEALRHVFAVASALDSLVVGEPQVLGQVKAAHRAAAAAGTLGPALDAVFQAAFATAKRVRTETEVAERPVSIAAASLQVARDLHGRLDRSVGLLVGPGEMGELMVEHLLRAGLGRLVVTGPSARRASLCARRFAANEAPFDTLEASLAASDVVVANVGSGRILLDVPTIDAALKRRRRRPMLFLDLGVPNDVEPAAGDLDGAFVYTLDDLERAAMAGRAGRERAATTAWAIVDAEVEAFSRRRAERGAVPAIVALRAHFEAVRASVLAETNDRDPEAVTRLLVNRLLHLPTEELRRAASEDPVAAAALADALRCLFPSEPRE